jgi:hypothetical protein
MEEINSPRRKNKLRKKNTEQLTRLKNKKSHEKILKTEQKKRKLEEYKSTNNFEMENESNKKQKKDNNEKTESKNFFLDIDTVWKNFRAFRKLRPAVKSFLLKLFNAGLFLPTSCPLCSATIVSSSTVHFLNCQKVVDLVKLKCNGTTPLDFVAQPIDTFRRLPVLPLLLYAIYCVCMSIHFEGEVPYDLNSRISSRLDDEIRRRDYTFH